MSRTSLRSSAHALSQPSPSSSVITSPPAASEINAVPVQPRRGGRTSFNWDSRQTDCLLEQVRAVLPRVHHEWEKVVANYNALMSESGCVQLHVLTHICHLLLCRPRDATVVVVSNGG